MQPGLAGALTECLKTRTWTVRQSTRQRPLREREQRWQQPGGKTRDERSLEKRQLRRIQQELRHEPSKVQENVQPIGLYCWTAFYDPPRARCQTAASAPATIRARLSAQRFVTQSSVAGQRQRSRSGRSARGKKCCHQGMICCCRARVGFADLLLVGREGRRRFASGCSGECLFDGRRLLAHANRISVQRSGGGPL